MKKLMLALIVFAATSASFAQTGKKVDSSKKATSKTATTKYTDNVDDRMKGPNGEKIYIGPNGGRYYLKGDKKVYVEYKGNKKKS